MPRVVKKTDLDRKLNTGEQRIVTGTQAKGSNARTAIVDELAWTMDPFARVPEEFRTYGEGVNQELDRAKAIQERVYAPNPHDMGGHDYHCEGEELGVCHGGPDHTPDCPDSSWKIPNETELPA